MSNNLDLARQIILEPASLEENDLLDALGSMLEHDIDLADLYFQNGRLESWSLEDGIIKSGNFSIETGVGVRAISGEKTGFAYSDVIEKKALQQAALAARSIANSGGSAKPQALSVSPEHSLYGPGNPVSKVTNEEKIALLQKIDREARAKDPRVTQVMASIVSAHDVILVVASDGTLAADVRPLIRCNVAVIVESEGRRERGSAGGGGRRDFSYFLEGENVAGYVDEAVRIALVNLEAQDAPAGQWPVVLGPGWPGVLLHEAVGHGLEGDFNRKGSSAFSGKVGQQVASSLCTVVDDGTLANRRGSLGIDDEGTPTQCTTLIENGILKGYMQDKLNAHLMGVAPTGNGRRESYAHLPMPRMTNTYMLPGESNRDEMIASIDRGLYAVNFAGGQVDITSGKFVFSTSEAYLVEKGKIVHPVKGATLIGNGPEVMNNISMVGDDLALDTGVGVCGKDGQSVPVGVGQPSLKIDELTIGGTGL